MSEMQKTKKQKIKERKLDSKLYIELKAQQVLETTEGEGIRMKIIKQLDQIFAEWVKTFAKSRGVTEEDAEKLNGHVYPFGSFWLGVNVRGVDLDAVCVAPKCIQRTDYFRSFYVHLKTRPEVTDIYAIEKAFVPLIKTTFSGVEVDLTFARLPLATVPEDIELGEGELLDRMNKVCQRSVYGCLVTHAIEGPIPIYPCFRLACRAIKHWAKTKGLYSNVLGFFGGLPLTIMVAKICEMHPTASFCEIVYQFFSFYSQWQWPKPIVLTNCFRYSRWIKDPPVDPVFMRDLMPIITPATPPHSCAHKITESAKQLIVTELQRGHNVVCQIFKGHFTWDRLFRTTNFFSRYLHYVIIFASSATKKDHLPWRGFVQSRIIRVIQDLELEDQIELVHANTKRFEMRKLDKNDKVDATPTLMRCLKSEFCSMWFIGLELNNTDDINRTIRENMGRFCGCVKEIGWRRYLYDDSMGVYGLYTQKSKLNQFLDEDLLQ